MHRRPKKPRDGSFCLMSSGSRSNFLFFTKNGSPNTLTGVSRYEYFFILTAVPFLCAAQKRIMSDFMQRKNKFSVDLRIVFYSEQLAVRRLAFKQFPVNNFRGKQLSV